MNLTFNVTIDTFCSSTYQSTVEYSCVNGFKLLEESTSVCTETGDWSVQSPQCIRMYILFCSTRSNRSFGIAHHN